MRFSSHITLDELCDWISLAGCGKTILCDRIRPHRSGGGRSMRGRPHPQVTMLALVGPAGLEPAAPGSEDRCSVH